MTMTEDEMYDEEEASMDGILECPCGWSTTSHQKFLTHRAKEHPDEPTGEFIDASDLTERLREGANTWASQPVKELLNDAARKLEQQAQTIALDADTMRGLQKQLVEAKDEATKLHRELSEIRATTPELAPGPDIDSLEEVAHAKGYRAGQEDLYEVLSNWIDGNSVTPEVELHLRELQHMLDIEIHYQLRED